MHANRKTAKANEHLFKTMRNGKPVHIQKSNSMVAMQLPCCQLFVGSAAVFPHLECKRLCILSVWWLMFYVVQARCVWVTTMPWQKHSSRQCSRVRVCQSGAFHRHCARSV